MGFPKVTSTEVTYISQVQMCALCSQGLAMILLNTIEEDMNRSSKMMEELVTICVLAVLYHLYHTTIQSVPLGDPHFVLILGRYNCVTLPLDLKE